MSCRTKSACLAFEAFVGHAAWRHPPALSAQEASASAGGASLGCRPRHVLDTGLSGLEPPHKGPGRRQNKGLFHWAAESRRLVPACCAGWAGAGSQRLLPQTQMQHHSPKSLIRGFHAQAAREPRDPEPTPFPCSEFLLAPCPCPTSESCALPVLVPNSPLPGSNHFASFSLS